MNVFLATIGCRLNEAEREAWGRTLRSRGHGLVDRDELADVVVINTCAVTAGAVRTSRQRVRKAHLRNPAARVVLTGCYSELETVEAESLPGVSLVVPNRDKDQLVATLEASFGEVVTPSEAAPAASSLRTRAFVKVQDGCRHRCTYCVVTLARGSERSRPIADVVGQIRDLCADGIKEVVISGVHLGAYGRELGVDLSDLVAAILAETPVTRLRMGSLEPWDLSPAFFPIWRDPRLCPHLHLPLQSGCDAVLRRMARRCDTTGFRAVIDAARSAIPELCITTDVIVGFPGETEREHDQSFGFIASVGLDDLHVFPYSSRPGTVAARLSSPIPKALKRQRAQQMIALGDRLRTTTLHRALHRRHEVLWEGRGVPTESGGLRWTGHTARFLTARVESPGGVNLRNTLSVMVPTSVVEGRILDGHLLTAVSPPEEVLARESQSIGV